MEGLAKSVEFLSKACFLKAVVDKNTINNIKFLPLGMTFLDNIRNEWHKKKEELNSYPAIGIGVQKSDNLNKFSFIKGKTLRESFLHVKSNFQSELPLIIKSEDHNRCGGESIHENAVQISLPHETLLATNYLFTPSVALEKFYHIQRERKICWMKYSSNPSRYYLSDLVTEEKGVHKLQSLKIKSKFGIGDMEVEQIHFVPIAAMALENEEDFLMTDARLGRSVLPICIRSEFKLENAAYALLLDSIENTRECVLALNRKLAPYQCALFSYFQDKNSITGLSDLSTHMSNVVRKVGISVLNLQKCHSNDWNALNFELTQMDRIGVPYCIILEQDTLKTGLMKLRSRDTTLSETIHITDVTNYLQKIFSSS